MATVNWAVNAGGDWSDSADWSTGTVPGQGDQAVISTSQPQTITHLSGNDSVISITVGDDIFGLAGGTLSVTSASSFAGQFIINGATFEANSAAITIGAFGLAGADDGSGSLTPAILDGTGAVTVTGAAEFDSGGEMTGTGTTTIEGNTTVNAGTADALGYFFGLGGGRVLDNAGTLTWTAGNMYLSFAGGGATIDNLSGATINVETDTAVEAGTGITAFVNAGTLVKQGSTGITDIEAKFSNTGTVSIHTGTISFDAGGTSSASAFSVAAGATLEFGAAGSSTFTVAPGTLALAGTLAVADGTLELGTVSGKVGGLTQTDGEIDGQGTLTVSGPSTLSMEVNFEIAYAEQSGTGTTILGNSTTIAGNVALNAGRTLENAGTLSWQAGTIVLGYNAFGTSYGGATLENLAGATFNIQTNTQIQSYNGPTAVINAGLFEQTLVSGQTDVEAAFTNTGTVTIQSGTVSFDAGGSSSATNFSVASGAVVAFDDAAAGGNFAFTGGILNVAGGVVIDNGELDVSKAAVTQLAGQVTIGNFEGAKLELGAVNATITQFTQTAGNLDGMGSLTVTGTATLNNNNGEEFWSGSGSTVLKGVTTLSGDLDLVGGRTLQNAGTLYWTAGRIGLGLNPTGVGVGGGSIVNLAGATLEVENSVVLGAFGGSDVFSNAGLLEQTQTVGLADIEVQFTNTGTVSVQSGTLSFDGGGSSSGSAFTVATGATLEFGADTNGGTFLVSGGTYSIAGATTVASGELNLSSAIIGSLGSQLTVGQSTLEIGARNATATTLIQSGQYGASSVIDGSGTLTVTGNATLGNYATETGSGTTTLDGTTSITALTVLDGGRTLANAGTLVLSGGWNLQLGATVGGATVSNLAKSTIEIETSSNIYTVKGATAVRNAGLFQQASTVSGATGIYASFYNTGSVSVLAGELSFADGGTSGGSAFTVAAGALLGFGVNTGLGNGTGTFALSGTGLNIAGTLDVEGGVLELGATTSSVGGLEQTAYGVVDGTGSLTVTGVASLSGLVESGTGSTRLQGATTISNTADLYGGRTLNNAGTLTWTGGSISLGTNPNGTSFGGGTIDNLAGATFSIEINSSILAGVGPALFTNAGLLDQNLTTGQTTIGVDFADTGTVDVQTGSLVFTGAGSSFSGVMDGTGQAVLDASDTAGALVIGGTLGVINESTLTATAQLTIGDQTTSTATFRNQAGATFDISGNSGVGAGKGNEVFSNSGLVQKTGGTGTSEFSIGVVNNGTIGATTGTVEFANAVTGTGALKVQGGAAMQFLSSVGAGQAIALSGSSAKLIGTAAGLAGTVSGFGGSDVIDLTGLTYGSTTKLSYSGTTTGGHLTISNGSQTAVLSLAGNYTTSEFHAATYGTSGTAITYV